MERNGGTTNTFRVHDELREAILSGTLKPGARIRAEAMAKRLNTSRTPVREALMLLAREGLVEIQPRRGAVVSAFDPADLVDLYEVRAVVEPHAALRAATRITPEDLARLHELCDLAEARGGDDAGAVEDLIAYNDEFHRIIAAAAGSPRLTAALRSVAGIPHAFRTAYWHDRPTRELSHGAHRQIVHALDLGNPALAEAAMRTHILAAQAFIAPGEDG